MAFSIKDEQFLSANAGSKTVRNVLAVSALLAGGFLIFMGMSELTWGALYGGVDIADMGKPWYQIPLDERAVDSALICVLGGAVGAFVWLLVPRLDR